MMIGRIHTKEDFIERALNLILSQIEKGPVCKIALSGGKTPIPIYEALGKILKTNLKNHQIEFFQVDERYINREDRESNYRMIQESLNHPIKHFDTSLSIAEALEKYKYELPEDGFDLTILGIGPDGHTASLFPHSAALETTEPVAHTTTDDFPIRDRLTITFPTIMKSKNLLVLLTNKPEIIKELQKPCKTAEEFPAHRLLEHRNLTIIALE